LLIQSLTSKTYESISGHLVGLLGQGISPSQGHYLHKTAQHRKMQTHIHASSRIWTHDPSVWAVEDYVSTGTSQYNIVNEWKQALSRT